MTTSTPTAPLTVSTDGTAGPYVIVTPEQFHLVAEALRAEGVRFQADEDVVRRNGAPALAVIELGRDADVGRVQGVLDRVSAELQTKGRNFGTSEASASTAALPCGPTSRRTAASGCASM